MMNYDAKSVAEVMGVTFVREPIEGAVPHVVVDTKLSAPEVNQVPPPSASLIEKAVELGLPRQALRHVAESLAGKDAAKVSAVESGIVRETALEGRDARLSPQDSERTERVARLFVQARRALGTAAEAREFMMSPHPELNGRSPLDAAMTDLGGRRAERILNALEYGLAV